jgi:hypothetical protein
MGIVARHPIRAPVAAPLVPPVTAFAAGLGDCAKAGALAAKPARSAIALIVFIGYLLRNCRASCLPDGPDSVLMTTRRHANTFGIKFDPYLFFLNGAVVF